MLLYLQAEYESCNCTNPAVETTEYAKQRHNYQVYWWISPVAGKSPPANKVCSKIAICVHRIITHDIVRNYIIHL